MRIIFAKTIAVTIVSVLVLSACGSDDDPTESALSAVCDAEEQVLEDVAALAATDLAETTGDDLQEMLDSLKSSVDDLQSARGDLAEQDVDNVSSAFDSLKAELSELGDVPVAELEDAAVATIEDALDAFQASYEEAYANSSCTSDESE